MLHHQSMRCGYWKKQYILGSTFPFISVSLPPSKLIKYSSQQLQSALVDSLWSAHPPHDEIIMCDYETLRHETKNGNDFLEETTGRSGTLPPQIFSPQIYILHNNRVWLVTTSLSTTVRHDETSASSIF